MSRETVIINNREFAMSKIPAFKANQIILKLQKLILPVIGELTVGGQDMDIRQIADVISSKLDDSVMNDIVMPMFKLAQVACTTESIKLDSELAIDKCFTVDDLFDFYELIFEVLKYQFGTFFAQASTRFGGNAGDLLKPAQI